MPRLVGGDFTQLSWLGRRRCANFTCSAVTRFWCPAKFIACLDHSSIKTPFSFHRLSIFDFKSFQYTHKNTLRGYAIFGMPLGCSVCFTGACITARNESRNKTKPMQEEELHARQDHCVSASSSGTCRPSCNSENPLELRGKCLVVLPCPFSY